ncbi:hypothetical protein QTP86_027546, partial [Hemibagrus guttatus]
TMRGKPKQLKWSNEAREAFKQLKESFASVSILKNPNPSRPFIIEVDASSCGIRAVLSQRHGSLGKIHPCTFFSRKLSPVESNYDVDNQELLSIKAVLEEWRLNAPVPKRPWSHMALDFITNLADSKGFNTILVAVDRFSKACGLVPLKGLPTAITTATTLFDHVFRNYGLPEDIVFDCGPQFTSRVWRAFCNLLGVNVNSEPETMVTLPQTQPSLYRPVPHHPPN